MKHLFAIIFLFALATVAQGQVSSQRVIFTTSNPPTVCTPGKVFTNSVAQKSWLGASDSSCVPYSMGGGAGTVTTSGSPASPQIAKFSSSTAITTATATDVSTPSQCADAGANDTYACSLAPAIASYVVGTKLRFFANTANTGAASINFNGVGALTIVKMAGGITTALADNDIRAGQWVDGIIAAGSNFQMTSQVGNAASAGANTALSNLASVAIATPLLAADTSVSAPAYAFTAKPNTGMAHQSSTGDRGDLIAAGTTVVGFFNGATDGAYLRAGDGGLYWDTNNLSNGVLAPELGIVKSASGFLEVNNGTTGTFAGLKMSATVLSSATVPITFSNAAFASCAGFTSSAGGVLTCTASDARLKNISPKPFGYGLKEVLSITPHYFSWKDGRQRGMRGGLIAQDVERAMPLAVTETGAGVKQIDQNVVNGAFVQSFKDLTARVEALTKQVRSQQRTIRRLRRH